MSSNFPPGDGQKVMLGFIVRKCAVELGRQPTPAEFAAWANNQEENGKRYNLFGKPITVSAAEIMLRQLGRLVTVRSHNVLRERRRRPNRG
jgi:hypothetical protein